MYLQLVITLHNKMRKSVMSNVLLLLMMFLRKRNDKIKEKEVTKPSQTLKLS